ncbi:lipopolysaccharide assembly protein LapB [Synechococcus sp. CS-205]|uniref:tetratricopeptide repeat protein n=1 Tax=Synechococcus sp. CS-205 TaxID=2847984 RepID=UPI00223A993C|nr:tetratricopeptide repeat protein [Synechococcus sp. CS-205]MCT0248619.1 tetratricopeptide repeat protein [Synechococcus sp. CS-205]
MPSRPSAAAVSSRSRPWLLALGAVALTMASLLTGWWLGQRSPEQKPVDRSRLELEQQAIRLQAEVNRGQASEGQQQRLLQLLLALDDKAEATALLERMADQQPQRWSLRLMLAELRRDQKDPTGAEREVRQLLNLRPELLEALQLMALIQLEQGRGAEAEALLTKAYQQASRKKAKEQTLAIGLLLADLHQRRGQLKAAEGLYRQLSATDPEDPRPLLGQALMRQQQGQTRQALELLDRARRLKPNQPDPRLDEVAAAWGLEPLRRAKGGKPPKEASPRAQPAQGQEPPGPPGP